ncbi:MAG: hypothetical protein IKU29_03875 [Parabacteroides sp.]|nr:hypothetical protein [Parabacteroides sp.]
MKLFGFTITRNSTLKDEEIRRKNDEEMRRKNDEDDLHIFRQCVELIDTTCQNGINRFNGIELTSGVIEKLVDCHESIDSLIDIYCSSKFSKPSEMFNLSSLTHEMRMMIVDYTHAFEEYLKAVSENDGVLKDMVVNRNLNDETCFEICKLHQPMYQILSCYIRSLYSIRVVIKYDLMRLRTGVDIIKDYYDSKENTVPSSGVDFSINFMRISRDEINAQIKNKKKTEETLNG